MSTNDSIVLRDYQEKAIEALRNGIREGKKRQVLCSSTGSGKTVIASYLTDESNKKNRRVIFLADRVALIDQTSETFDRYGIPHGVMQGNHWRWRPNEPIQIATPQTLAKRKWPSCDLLIVDECHALYKTTTDKLALNDCVAIGLTATPFTSGIGKIYEGVVNVITMNELIEQGHLSKYKIFASNEPDMTGAKVVAGEWQDNEAAERSMKIVGDCVSEYIKHGQGQKFIAFGCNVAHCLDSQTEILTKRGWATIDDISEQDLVASFNYKTNANGKISFNKPKGIISREVADGEKFMVVDNKFLNMRVTGDHRMLVQPSRRSHLPPFEFKFKLAKDCAGSRRYHIPVSGNCEPFLEKIDGVKHPSDLKWMFADMYIKEKRMVHLQQTIKWLCGGFQVDAIPVFTKEMEWGIWMNI
jgi:hypothetical protein